MRVVTLIVAALVTIGSIVVSRRDAKAEKKAEAPVKPGHSEVPKLPKIKRYGV